MHLKCLEEIGTTLEFVYLAYPFLTCLQAFGASVVSVCTRANISPTTVGAVDQRTLSSLAVYITEPNRTYSLPIFGILSLVDGLDQSQLITDHERVV